MSTFGMVHSRRWFAAAALAAMVPLPAVTQLKPDDGDDSERDASDSEDAYTSPEFGMEVTWEAPWELDDVSERADVGFEAVSLHPGGAADYLRLSTSLIGADFGSAEEYLDHYEESYAPEKIEVLRDHTDGVHYLLGERTEASLTVMFFFTTRSGQVFELYEHRAEPDAEYATTSILMVYDGEVFEGHFKGAQSFVTLNGDEPFTTVDTNDVIDLATAALQGEYPDRHGDEEDDEESAGGSSEDDDMELPAAADNTAAINQQIEEIRQHFDQIDPTAEEFVELLGVESLSRSQARRANAILDLWLAAPAEAARHDLPATHADLEDAYLAYTDNLEQAATSFITAISDESSEAEVDAALDGFSAAMAAHVNLSDTLDTVLRRYE